MSKSKNTADVTRKVNQDGICQNCGATLTGDYCHVCGQAAKEPRRAVIGLVQDVFVDTLAIDGKLARTLGLLLWRPGRLARRYLEGKRVSYSPPFRIYLFASVFFFFALFWATDAQVGAFRVNVGDTDAALEQLSPEERAEVEESLREAREMFGETSPEVDEILARVEAAAAEEEDAATEGNAEDAGESDGEAAATDESVPFKDREWVDVNFDGPDWFEPHAKRIFEAAQRVSEDPRLFIAETRQNVPRVLLLAPVAYGVVLLLLYIYRRKYFVYDHFVVSLYMHAALYAYLLLALVLSAIPVLRTIWFVPLVIGWFQPFLVFRQAYGSGWISSWLKWFVSITIYLAAFASIIGLGLSYSLYQS